MEGLIPFVIHAIKKKQERSRYRCLSEGSTGRGGSRKPLVVDWPQENSAHHRRTRSDLPRPLSDPNTSPPIRSSPRLEA